MENVHLLLFLKIFHKADVKLLIYNSVLGMIGFSDSETFEKYELSMEENCQLGGFEHMANLIEAKGHSAAYCKCLLTQFDTVISFYKEEEGYLVHKRLTITDTESHSYLFSDMPDDIKRKISQYVYLQRSFLFRFIRMVNGPEDSSYTKKIAEIEASEPIEAYNYKKTIPEKNHENIHYDVSDKTKWLDNEDVCRILNISKRTLQSYRDNGCLPYYRIRKKIYYKKEDIDRILEMGKNFKKKNGAN
jgi:hypothetical protein